MEEYSQFVSNIAKFVGHIEDNAANVEAKIKECNRKLKEMRKLISNIRSVGTKQRIIACIAQVHGFRVKMKLARTKIGTGYKPTNPNRENYRSMRVKWEDVNSAFANRIRTGVFVNLKHLDSKAFLEDCRELFARRIKNVLKKEDGVKVNTSFCGEFKIVKSGVEMMEFKHMTTKNIPIYRDTDLKEWFGENVINSIMAQLEEFQEKDSGWALSAIVNLVVNICKFTPQLGSSYIKLPKWITSKKACVNVKNDDNACFAWAVTSALYPAKKSSDRISSYPNYSKVLNLKNIMMPMTIKQIPRFEKQNDISINVYIIEKKRVLPTYLTKDKMAKHVNLLLIDDGEEKPTFHYVWIKNISRLVSSQLSKHAHKKYFCDRCLHYFCTNLKLTKHIEDCTNINNCALLCPEPGTKMRFKNYQNKEKTPFVIYADLECLLVPGKNEKMEEQSHVPYSIGYYVKCSYDDTLSFYRSYRGEGCQQWFAQEMKQFAEDVETVFLCPLPMELTSEQEEEFQLATHCHICERAFDTSHKRVRDHSHITGLYRGPAHEDCNINFQDSHVIPIVFHNLSGYDSHFIIKNIAKDFEGNVDLLPVTKEKYISFTKNIKDNLIKFRFIDSFRFLTNSLEKLASYLPEYPILQSEFPKYDEFKLLTRKGVFPYEYMDSWAKLDCLLPSISKFYSSLTDSNISDDDYAHACNVYKQFNCQNLGEYSDLYMKTDILLLADVFEQFRSSCISTYGLDPARYITLPSYTWDAMMHYTKIELELLSDIDMIMFIERGIRGGLSQCSKRYAKANNKYMKNYNPNESSKYLAYFDINNQYGWAMSQYLPYGGFEWVENVENFNFNVPIDNPEGYILEVDLDYPDTIHDKHSDLPFCPEHKAPPSSKDEKLLATLYNKGRYVIHYRNLQQVLENGLILKKINKILKFKQSDWLKSYIDLNTRLRTAATNDFDKDLFKLMNNAVFGKTMENIRNHSIVKLITKWEGRYGAEALISKPQFKSCTIFDENLVAIELNKSKVFFSKPIYVGMCILDISKIKIYDFHYSYMKPKFGDNAVVCYTDTDSLIYEVECDDLYEIIKNDCNEHFDTSDYPEHNVYGIPRVNKKVLGMMKDENCGKILIEFVGHRSKAYAYRVECEGYAKKAKGVKKHIVKNRITFDDYVNCLKTSEKLIVQQKLFKSNLHNVSTIEQTKIALSSYDTKRYICSNGINTLPWGHYAIMDVCD